MNTIGQYDKDSHHNDWNQLIPVIDKEVKAGKSNNAIFKIFSNGINTERDEWMYDFSKENLSSKMKYFIDVYKSAFEKINQNNGIKWDTEPGKEFDESEIIEALYRPFVKQYFYFDQLLGGQTFQWYEIFRQKRANKFIAINSPAIPDDFFCLTSNTVCDLHLTGESQCLPFSVFKNEEQIDNITDWALHLFREHYQPIENSSPVCYANSPEVRAEFQLEIPAPKPITKEAIFHYVYAVFHNPAYRKKYELNLKKEFPRIPLYDNFWKWTRWGEQLMNLHINYGTNEPYPLQRKEIATQEHPKAKLNAIKEDGTIVIDENTELHSIPSPAWEYKPGNRSALEWILDQYKEKKPDDPTIAEKFNTYKFADYKDQVIDLLKRVCTMSVETEKILDKMDGR